ncbi:hypothetical protein WAG28_20060 [Bacillus cereus]|uniref:hypothetical protein n=1 Tax=Bacillus cereus group TaxID=86661 RepID=UPI000BFC630B|nr:hypothetical protein [Bacillus wiedmannii]PHF89962.1 hypothetical protein COI45_26980 [Bacillus wiedmannii]
MVENPITYGNYHDSSARDFMDYCEDCDGELYFGMTYYKFEGSIICEECSSGFLERHARKMVAGE